MIHRHALPSFLVAACLAHATASAQNRFPLTESYDPASFIEPGVDPGDVVVVNTDILGGTDIEWEEFDLGLPVAANVDAFSIGFDIFPPSGPATTVPPANCNAGGFIEAQFTLDPTSEGPPGGPIEEQVGGNGAMSDTFAARWSGSSIAALRLETDALEIDPSTDLDALAWPERRRYPAYFSVDVPTAALLGLDPASVYLAPGDGTFSELYSSATLGLMPGDDIDGLAVAAMFGVPPSPFGRVVFSLTRTSPSVLPGGPIADVTPAGLAVAKVGGPGEWAFPENLQTDGLLDNINGVRITDPIWEHFCDGSQPNFVTGHPYDTLLFDGTAGNIARYVDQRVNQSFQLWIQPQDPIGDLWLVFAAIGAPNCSLPFSDPLFPTPMALHPGLSVASAVGVGQLQVQLNYPFQLDLAVQGIVVDQQGMVHKTNLVTALVR